MNSHLRSYGMTRALVVLCMVPMCAFAQGGGGAIRADAEAAMKAAAAKPTPRLADGHPDLNGYWDFYQAPTSDHVGSDGTIFIDLPPEKGGAIVRRDRSLEDQLTPPVDPNPPSYKPELLAKVKAMALDEVHNDPAFHCLPRGVPRVGAPRQIVQTTKLTLLLYQIDGGIGDQPGSYRLVPTSGGLHRTDVDPSFFGDSIGHWEGDTLVVDVTHLNDQTWLAG